MEDSRTNATRTVSLRFLPFTITLSPLNKFNVSIVLLLIVMTLLSSFVASSTTKEFGLFFLRKIAVAVLSVSDSGSAYVSSEPRAIA